MSRGAAENALRLMGPAARPSLEALAGDAASDPTGDTPTDRIRRRIARTILADLG